MNIATEFGGSAPFNLTSYYRNGTFCPNLTENAGIPTSGDLSLKNYYGGLFSYIPGALGGYAIVQGDTVLYATWGAPTRGGTPTSYYVSLYNGDGTFVKTVQVSIPTASFSALTNGSQYEIRVLASNSYGNGAIVSLTNSPTPSLWKRMYPPISLASTPSASTYTVSSQGYGNGLYKMSASTVLNNKYVTYALDRSTSNYWQSGANYSAYAYVGPGTAVIINGSGFGTGNITVIGVGGTVSNRSYKGDWMKLELPYGVAPWKINLNLVDYNPDTSLGGAFQYIIAGGATTNGPWTQLVAQTGYPTGYLNRTFTFTTFDATYPVFLLLITQNARASTAVYNFEIEEFSNPLYSFTSFVFTTMGCTGRLGPTTITYGASTPGYGTAYAVTVNNGIQTWTVPDTGTYRIKCIGANGCSAVGGWFGGKGMSAQGDVVLNKGDKLKLIVGQQGMGVRVGSDAPGYNYTTGTWENPTVVLQSTEYVAGTSWEPFFGGGGGGTFVFLNSIGIANLLIAGGGGGGAGFDKAAKPSINFYSFTQRYGVDATSTTSGSASSGSSPGGIAGGAGTGGTGCHRDTGASAASPGGSTTTGEGGSASVSSGGSGGAGCASISSTATFNGGYPNGGFGGGGSGGGYYFRIAGPVWDGVDWIWAYGGGSGGGGGYSGGGGGTCGTSYTTTIGGYHREYVAEGGGGGSFINSSMSNATYAANSYGSVEGSITITKL